jgi:hypothetical protein
MQHLVLGSNARLDADSQHATTEVRASNHAGAQRSLFVAGTHSGGHGAGGLRADYMGGVEDGISIVLEHECMDEGADYPALGAGSMQASDVHSAASVRPGACSGSCAEGTQDREMDDADGFAVEHTRSHMAQLWINGH